MQKNIVYTVLLFVALAALIWGGIYYQKNQQAKLSGLYGDAATGDATSDGSAPADQLTPQEGLEPADVAVQDQPVEYRDKMGRYVLQRPGNWPLFSETDRTATFVSNRAERIEAPGLLGFTLGPQFSVAYRQTSDIGATTTDGWLEKNGFLGNGPGFIESQRIELNGLEMLKVITIGAGGKGDVLNYIYFIDEASLVNLTFFPYMAGDADTRIFEDVVIKSFQPVR